MTSAGARFFAALCQLPIICRTYIIYIFLFINNAAPKIPKKKLPPCAVEHAADTGNDILQCEH